MKSNSKSQKGQQGKKPIKRSQFYGTNRIQVQPPQFEPTFTIGHKFRYISNAALVDTQILTGALMRLIVMAISTTQTNCLFTAFKIRSVRMWAAGSQTVPVTISLEFVDNSSAGVSVGIKPKVFSDTSIGMTRNAILKAKPDPRSAPGMWQNFNTQGSPATDSNGAGFILNGPQGVVLDLSLTLLLQNGEAPNVGRTTTATTLVTGTIYQDFLDNGAGGSGTFFLVPQGYNPLPI